MRIQETGPKAIQYDTLELEVTIYTFYKITYFKK